MSFLYGLLISFSPCILPMIPIILKMCGTTKGTVSYLIGNVISYALLGIVLSSVGIYFQNVMHSWPVILMFTLALGYLTLTCFDIVRIPQYYIHSSNTFLMGLITPIIVSPCITPALGGIITLMVQSRCLECGILDLLFFGLGVNIPIVLASFGLGKLLRSPRIQKYSGYVTKLNGVLLIGLIGYLWYPLIIGG